MLVELKNVTKKYEKFELVCSLDVEQGHVTGLIGQNGAGKSTTFKAILSLIKVDGTVTVFGKPAAKLQAEDKEKIGVVLSDAGFSGYLNLNAIVPVMENMYENFEKEKFLNQCQHFNLPMDKKLKEFSTGMKAKAKVLLAMSHKADLLILDEPTAGLDVIARDELLDILREYMEEDDKRAILISSHISSDLEGLCDDIYMIDEGKIVLHEDTDNLLSEYGLLKLTKEQYHTLDRRYILKTKENQDIFQCLTSQKSYYQENMPGVVIEKGNIDDVITMMIQGK